MRKNLNLKQDHFSKAQFLIFILAFGVIGIVIYLGFAAAPSTITNSPAEVNNVGPSVYWGAWIDGDVYSIGSDDAPWSGPIAGGSWDQFEAHAGKKVSILHYGQPPPWSQAFAPGTANFVTNRGAIPFMSMDSGNVPLTDIANGVYDTSIKTWANAVKSWGKPFMLRWDWEMNGTWFNWGAQAKQSPANYIAAWRHFHDLVAAAGASNVTWVWCPNTEFSGSTALESLYPGGSYVDWTCIDGYNWGTNPNKPDSWQSFSSVFKATYDHLNQLAADKPIIIGETASSEFGGNKASWITDAFSTQLPANFPAVKAVLWFNWNIVQGSGRMDWPIESSPSAQAAFAGAISNAYYASNNYGGLPALTKVQPLSPPVNTPPPPTPIPGDLTGDGHVTLLDLSILLSHYGQSATALQGDLNTDGKVTLIDLSILLSHYGD